GVSRLYGLTRFEGRVALISPPRVGLFRGWIEMIVRFTRITTRAGIAIAISLSRKRATDAVVRARIVVVERCAGDVAVGAIVDEEMRSAEARMQVRQIGRLFG